jgi:hypothetical protein
MAIGMNTELLKILRSGAFGGAGADPVEERRSDAAAVQHDRRRTKRLVGLAIADQVSQRDATACQSAAFTSVTRQRAPTKHGSGRSPSTSSRAQG